MEGKIRERIIRVLLHYPEGSISTSYLARAAKCSRPWVIEFLHKLAKLGLIERIYARSKNNKIIEGSRIINIIGLIDYWKNINPYPHVMGEYHIQKPIDILKKINLKYSLTTYFAESLTQRYLFPSRIDFYIIYTDASMWHSLLTKNGLAGKGNVRVLFEDPHVFYRNYKRRELSIVSIPQLIFDLYREGGVAKEAAFMMIEKRYYGTLPKF